MGGFPQKGAGLEKRFEAPNSLKGWDCTWRENGTVVCAFNPQTGTLRLNRDIYPGFVELHGIAYRLVAEEHGGEAFVELPVTEMQFLKGDFTKDFHGVKRLGYLAPDQKRGEVVNG